MNQTVPARSGQIAQKAHSRLVQAVIDDMLEAGEDPTSTSLYLLRFAEAKMQLLAILA